MSLVAHRGKLFAGLGYWMDVPYLEDKPAGPWTGAQVVVKDSAESPWRVEVSFGPSYLRTEALARLTLTTDGFGNRLVPPVTLLVAGPSDQDPSGTKWATAWTLDDDTGTWTASRVATEPAGAGVRSKEGSTGGSTASCRAGNGCTSGPTSPRRMARATRRGSCVG